VLKPLRPAADAILLQVVFVERPADDSLVRHLVWQDLDQVGAVPPATRSLLIDHGFRVGLAGAQPPPALQTLLGLTAEVGDPLLDDRLMNVRRLGLRPGQDTELLTHREPFQGTLTYRLEGRSEDVSYRDARCLLRVKPHRLDNGWVRVDFTPEIHHGDARLRHTPTEAGWTLHAGQQADIRQSLKFSVTLNTGELAVIGCEADASGTPASAFFGSTEAGRAVQRLLVVRLQDPGAP
jgi:hypothetical protein